MVSDIKRPCLRRTPQKNSVFVDCWLDDVDWRTSWMLVLTDYSVVVPVPYSDPYPHWL